MGNVEEVVPLFYCKKPLMIVVFPRNGSHSGGLRALDRGVVARHVEEILSKILVLAVRGPLGEFSVCPGYMWIMISEPEES